MIEHESYKSRVGRAIVYMKFGNLINQDILVELGMNFELELRGKSQQEHEEGNALIAEMFALYHEIIDKMKEGGKKKPEDK